jgi:hypothetical protein
MFKITGFDALQKELQTASRALKALDGTVAKLKFDPSDQRSVDAAIKEMERAIDRKVAPYRNNEIVRNLANEMKASYKSEIRAQARKASRAA